MAEASLYAHFLDSGRDKFDDSSCLSESMCETGCPSKVSTNLSKGN